MIQKKFLIITMMIAIILISGCGSNTDTSTVKTTPFVGGSTAVVLSFIDGAPPEEIFDKGNYPFGVGVKIENKGEYTIPQNEGSVEIIGINPSDFKTSSSGLKKNLNEDLTGVKKNFEGEALAGGIGVVEFTNLAYTPDITGNFEVTLRAEMCYNYITMTSTKICIKRNLLDSISDNRICDLAGAKSPQNSGAPVHITTLSETPMGQDKIQVLFEIAHVGAANDRIYKKGTDCDYSVTNMDRNKVFVKVTSKINGNTPSCNGLEGSNGGAEGYITLYDMQPMKVSCSLDVSSVSGIYEDLFTVDLEYRYSQFIETPLLIKDVN